MDFENSLESATLKLNLIMEKPLTPKQARVLASLKRDIDALEEEREFVKKLTEKTKKDYPSLTLYEVDLLLDAASARSKSLEKQIKKKKGYAYSLVNNY